MKQMGIQQVEVEANEVIINCPEKKIVIMNPSVSKVNMMGQETWQVIGEAVEQPLSSEPQISEEDIRTVAEQANVSLEEARIALEQTNGDLAEAIMILKK